MMRIFLLTLVAGLLFSGCKKEEPGKKPVSSSEAGGNPLTAPVDYLGAVGKAQKSATKTLSAAGLQQAIQMFYSQEGRFPMELKELAPGYIGQIPPAPVGMKYDYDPKTGTLKIVPQ
jgi:hypothetical protein